MDPGDADLFIDECVPIQVAEGLKTAGWDALTAHGAGRLGLFDVLQLEFAAGQNRILVTFDPDFSEIHTQWVADGRRHSGILLSAEYKDVKRYLADLRHTLAVLDASAFPDNLHWVLKA